MGADETPNDQVLPLQHPPLSAQERPFQVAFYWRYEYHNIFLAMFQGYIGIFPYIAFT